MSKKANLYLFQILMIFLIGISSCSQNNSFPTTEITTEDQVTNIPTILPRDTSTPIPLPTIKISTPTNTQTQNIIDQPILTKEPTDTPQPQLANTPTIAPFIPLSGIVQLANTPTIAPFIPLSGIYIPVTGGGGSVEHCLNRFEEGNYNSSSNPSFSLLNEDYLVHGINSQKSGFTLCLFLLSMDKHYRILFSHEVSGIRLEGEFGLVQEDDGHVNISWSKPQNISSLHGGDAIAIRKNSAILEIDFWWSGNLPSGEWSIQVVEKESNKFLSSATYFINQDGLSRLEVPKETESFTLNPTHYSNGDDEPFCQYLYFYKIHSLIIWGLNLPPDEQINLQVYNADFIKILESNIISNSSGKFSYEVFPHLLNSGEQHFIRATWIAHDEVYEYEEIDYCFVLPEN